MQRSSETIGAIAGALAKAQIELANPEKSLTATIRSPFSRDADRSFRYASLANGLDLVRKSLGRHEIATVQTTSIDDTAGLIRLTTTLAHSSGEWVSSDWPVCQVSETNTPHRMGAALTYARCYALFTLVGITGDDDLDAPDLLDNPPPTIAAEARGSVGQKPSNGSKPRHSKPLLAAEASAALRDRFLTELEAIQSTDDAASWAHRNLPAKNTLTVADAQIVESGFRTKLAALDGGNLLEATQSLDVAEPAGPNLHDETAGVALPEQPTAGRGRAAEKTIRLRDKDHRKFVATQPCIVCGRTPADAHHLRFAQPRALGRKVSDEFTVPVCRLHHRELHRHGDEVAWWQGNNIDPLRVALKLWRARFDGEAVAVSGDTSATSS